MRKNVREAISKLTEKFPDDNVKIMTRLAIVMDANWHLEKILDSYFREIEGLDFATDKKYFVINKMTEAANKNINLSLQQTYADYRKEIDDPTALSEYADNLTCYWCPLSLFDTDDAFDMISKVEDVTKVVEYLKTKREFVKPIINAMNDSFDKENKRMFDEAKRFVYCESVCDYAKRFDEVDFELRNEEGRMIGLYTRNIKEHSRKQILKIANEVDSNGIHHATLFLKTLKNTNFI